MIRLNRSGLRLSLCSIPSFARILSVSFPDPILVVFNFSIIFMIFGGSWFSLLCPIVFIIDHLFLKFCCSLIGIEIYMVLSVYLLILLNSFVIFLSNSSPFYFSYFDFLMLLFTSSSFSDQSLSVVSVFTCIFFSVVS